MRLLVAAVLVGCLWSAAQRADARPSTTDDDTAEPQKQSPFGRARSDRNGESPRKKARKSKSSDDEVIVVVEDDDARPSRKATDSKKSKRADLAKNEPARKSGKKSKAADDDSIVLVDDDARPSKSSKRGDVKGKGSKRAGAKGSSKRAADDDSIVVVDDDARPSKSSKRGDANGKGSKRGDAKGSSKRAADDDSIVVIDDDAPAKGSKRGAIAKGSKRAGDDATGDGVRPTKASKRGDAKGSKRAADDDSIVVIDDAPTKGSRRGANDSIVVVDDDAPAKGSSRGAIAKGSRRAGDDATGDGVRPTKGSKRADAKGGSKRAAGDDSIVADDGRPGKTSKRADVEGKGSKRAGDDAIAADDDARPSKGSKRAPRGKNWKRAADDGWTVVPDDGARPAKASKDDAANSDESIAKVEPMRKAGKTSKSNKQDGKALGTSRPAKTEDEDAIVIDDDDDTGVRPAKADPAAKQSARLDVEASEEVSDNDSGEPAAITKVAVRERKTRFYFRAGGFKASTKLGATEFSLQTDLPIDTSNLGAGSGVVLDQKQYPVSVTVGYVLPILHRKLSLETVLGFPTATRFRATGALAEQSLAPTFMGMTTGIEALGPDLGEATFATPVVTAVYRIADLGPVTPIAGAGVMLLMARNAKITNSVLNEAGDPKLSIKPSPGLALQAGVDIKLFGRVSARLEAKYVLGMKVNAKVEGIAVTPKAIPALGSIDVGDAVLSAKVTPFVLQAGIGADF